MIKISIYKNAESKIIGFRCLGHAGFAKSGQDIVCAAVSVLVINTVNSIEHFTSDTFDLKEDENKGEIDFKIVSKPSKESSLLLNSLFLGLQGIKEDYGQEYIKLI
ncbi:ribosomal-processing cysteine protease Prp [Anaerocolumna sp. MB42-C2]|uniref:ribosomal-processing cysteine protease Prp n=1 Tax=Anaerocolumna sp. MB42-C2 TaxID=3070997 RepID=UPI0027E152B8|nr:ribosomal-processing cysteine protease Prp [Anaerocolumna sp. MB42-C2]WMJ88146.1 ribosomal-processing cysteine protease Prp [Anaerocolumna sp. MB42-C2]